MRNWKLLPALTGITLVIAIVLYIAFYFVFVDFFVDLWWFKSLNFEAYFWLKTLYRFIFSGGVTVFFFGIFLFHFWIASRYLGFNTNDEIALDSLKAQRLKHVTELFLSGSSKIYTPISLLLAIIIALPFYQQWEHALLFFFGQASGVEDPVFSNDISFYLFQYPMYLLVQKQLLISAGIVLLTTFALYWFEHNYLPNQAKAFPLGAKVHLMGLFILFMLFVIWGFLLNRFSLLYIDKYQPVFFGPGFVELRYQLPLIWLTIVALLTICLAVTFYVFSERHRSRAPIIISVFGLLTVLGLQHIHIIPELLEKIIVKPNFSRIESDAMLDNIDATLTAFDLDNIKTVDFNVSLDASKDIEDWSSRRHFENIPVWDREFLQDSYTQLQGLRPYYGFPTVNEDRYFLNGHYQQVNLAAREINTDKLPKEAQNWENLHLRYTHGYGAVISPAAQDAGIPIIWYLRDLNMSSTVGFNVHFPDIYYGQGTYHYAIVPNGLGAQDISGTSPSDTQNYHGESGIPISSYFRKILLANYLHDEKVFLSPNINEQSKLLIRQNIRERINHLTPFLHLDKEPYLVLSKDRFYWVQDAYTLSKYYPVSKPTSEQFQKENQQFNYIRNAVKIVVDAYDGQVDYYIADQKDPLINAYNRAYPGFFKTLVDMPDELKQHLRYPRDLFEVQMNVYAKYHQKSPEQFYSQAETWQYAYVDGQAVLPYFITLDLDHCNDKEEFIMINPMTPVHRENLSMIGVASTLDNQACGNAYKSSITVFNFPKAVQVNGPAQVNALIDQNPEIAAQFTLWNQQGSEVKKGRMVILPMGNSILYVQPIYMLATHTKMPELARVIVSIGNQVVMEKTLQTALDQLKAKFVVDAGATKSGITSTGQP